MMMNFTFNGPCPICSSELQQDIENPSTYLCPTGHYKVKMYLSYPGLSATLPRNWEDKPAKMPIPQEFHDAFQDVEVIEP